MAANHSPPAEHEYQSIEAHYGGGALGYTKKRSHSAEPINGFPLPPVDYKYGGRVEGFWVMAIESLVV